ncbi:MAG: hypothetical protein ACI9U2_001384 [Bradymonadia bacterium]|jgi:hypothetical protein
MRREDEMSRFTYDQSALAEVPILAVPAGIREPKDLFAAYSPMLPGWFGDNFDALADVLTSHPTPLRVVHTDVPLVGAERQIYLDILDESDLIAIFPATARIAIEAALDPTEV